MSAKYKVSVIIPVSYTHLDVYKRQVHENAKRLGIDMPIVNEIYQVLFEDKNPEDSARDLMLRDLKSEINF